MTTTCCLPTGDSDPATRTSDAGTGTFCPLTGRGGESPPPALHHVDAPGKAKRGPASTSSPRSTAWSRPLIPGTVLGYTLRV